MDVDPGPALRGTLRPYQKAGVRWLHLLSGLGLGACLADDMGLGKTIQVLSLLLVRTGGAAPAAAAEPAGGAGLAAGQLGGGDREIRSQPEAVIVHPSAMPAEQMKASPPEQAAELDLAITSYGSLLRMPVFAETDWRFAILDEAQAIKNPNARRPGRPRR